MVREGRPCRATLRRTGRRAPARFVRGCLAGRERIGCAIAVGARSCRSWWPDQGPVRYMPTTTTMRTAIPTNSKITPGLIWAPPLRCYAGRDGRMTLQTAPYCAASPSDPGARRRRRMLAAASLIEQSGCRTVMHLAAPGRGRTRARQARSRGRPPAAAIGTGTAHLAQPVADRAIPAVEVGLVSRDEGAFTTCRWMHA